MATETKRRRISDLTDEEVRAQTEYMRAEAMRYRGLRNQLGLAFRTAQHEAHELWSETLIPDGDSATPPKS